MDNPDSVLLYRRILSPSLDLVDHATKLGINLRTKGLISTSAQRNLRKCSAGPFNQSEGPHPSQVYGRTGSAHKVRSTYATPTCTYIQNVVVPLNTPDYTNASLNAPYNSLQSKSAYSSSHRPSSGQYSIQHTKRRAHSAYAAPTSSPRERSFAGSTTSSRKTANSSGQALRFETEQDDLTKCRTRKRTTEIRPHRVDRMYYMTGSTLRPANKYWVEDDELAQLQELSRVRKESKHYGRGLSPQMTDDILSSPMHREPLPQRPPSIQGDAEIRNGPMVGDHGDKVVPVNIVKPNKRAEDLNSVSEGLMSGRHTPAIEPEAEQDRPASVDRISEHLDKLNVQDTDLESVLQGEEQETNEQCPNTPIPSEEQNEQSYDKDSGMHGMGDNLVNDTEDCEPGDPEENVQGDPEENIQENEIMEQNN